ncbi:hypothetical protein Tco_0594636, partial [Tanacetum coccineum]
PESDPKEDLEEDDEEDPEEDPADYPADTLEAAPGRRMSRELGYGIRDTWDDLLVGAIQEIALTTLEGVNQRVIELSSTVDQEDEIIYS